MAENRLRRCGQKHGSSSHFGPLNPTRISVERTSSLTRSVTGACASPLQRSRASGVPACVIQGILGEQRMRTFAILLAVIQLHPGCGSKRLWSGVPLYDFRRVRSGWLGHRSQGMERMPCHDTSASFLPDWLRLEASPTGLRADRQGLALGSPDLD
jgi:hypothetical protein